MNVPDEPRDGYLQNGGLRLHFAEWGDARRPPMLLLHGMRDCARSWDVFAKAMSADYSVAALDSRGHGDSDDAPPGGYRFADHVSDVKAVVERRDPRRPAVIVGHSAGGRYAWSFAVENPTRVRALIVVDIDPDPRNPQTARDFARIAEEPDSYPAMERFIERLRERQPFTDADTLARQARFLSKPAPGGGFAWKADIRTVTEYERPDLWESWRRIACPVLLVRGRQSDLLTHETAVRMREALPPGRARLAELEGGGHWFHQDFPGAFEAAARWFLDGLG